MSIKMSLKKALTVGELIAELRKLPSYLPVYGDQDSTFVYPVSEITIDSGKVILEKSKK